MLAFFFVFVLGLCVGSFLNVCVLRMLSSESIFFPGSNCPLCKSPIKPKDNIPVLSFILLSGRCRSCGEKISVMYPLVELATGLLFALAWLRFGFSLELVRGCFLVFLVLSTSLTDIREGVIPNLLIYVFGLLGILTALQYGVPGLYRSLLGITLGIVVLGIIALFGRIVFRKPAMGEGDIKLIGAVGAYLEGDGVLLTLYIAVIVGGIYGIFTVIFRRKALQDRIPFGPFIGLSALLVLFFSDGILSLIGRILGFS